MCWIWLSCLVNVNGQDEHTLWLVQMQDSLSHLSVCFIHKQVEHFGDDGFKETWNEVVWNGGERSKDL